MHFRKTANKWQTATKENCCSGAALCTLTQVNELLGDLDLVSVLTKELQFTTAHQICDFRPENLAHRLGCARSAWPGVFPTARAFGERSCGMMHLLLAAPLPLSPAISLSLSVCCRFASLRVGNRIYLSTAAAKGGRVGWQAGGRCSVPSKGAPIHLRPTSHANCYPECFAPGGAGDSDTEKVPILAQQSAFVFW